MIINLPKLPKNFTYKMPSSEKYGYAYVDEERNLLIIKGEVSFSKLIYRIMYDLNSVDVCPYCGRNLKEQNIRTTLDHIIPVDRGGPTIPQNLTICCEKCNEEKNNMDKDEYQYFKHLKTEKERMIFKKNLGKLNEKIKHQRGNDIPEEWLIDPKQVDILVTINFRKELKASKKYQRVKKAYKKYNHLIYPVIIDRNDVLLDGFHTLMFSKEYNVPDITVIKIGNVEKKI